MYKNIVGFLIALGLGYFLYLRVLKGNRALQKYAKKDVKQVNRFLKNQSKNIHKKVGR